MRSTFCTTDHDCTNLPQVRRLAWARDASCAIADSFAVRSSQLSEMVVVILWLAELWLYVVHCSCGVHARAYKV